MRTDMGPAVLSRLLTADGWTLVVVIAYLVLLAVPIVVASLTRDAARRADMLRLVLALTPYRPARCGSWPGCSATRRRRAGNVKSSRPGGTQSPDQAKTAPPKMK